MHSRIQVHSLPPPLLEESLLQAMKETESEINKLKDLNPDWLLFFREKSQMAIETLSFILKQKMSTYCQGYPSKNTGYLAIIERQMQEIKAVYFAFFKFAPGLIYELKDTAPDVFVWLMLEPEWGETPSHLMLGFHQLENISQDLAKMLILHSTVSHLDYFLASLIEGFPKWAALSFTYMTLRHSLSIGAATHWLKEKKLDAQIVFPVLSLLNVKEGQQWVDENATQAEYLFERLLHQPKGRKERGPVWFRALFDHTSSLDENASKDIVTFATLLELRECMHFDPHSKNAPIELALSGNMAWVSRAFEHIKTCKEEEGAQWIQAFYILYGDLSPVHPQNVGIDHDWIEVITLFEAWMEKGGHLSAFSLRLGAPLDFISTLRALKDPFIHAQFRHWIWYQLCIHTRMFVFLDPLMPCFLQDKLFNKIEALDLSHRFDQRNAHAVMGH